MTEEAQEMTARETQESKDEAHLYSSQPDHAYRFEEGAKIGGRYKVLAWLGFGGFAEVYHCEDTDLGRHVAVKVLKDVKELQKIKEEKYS